jgi:membrane peptidoglycan carboxypeptidase
MVAAVSSIANGGQYIEPRIVRAAYRDNRRYSVQAKVVRRTVSANTAATLTTIMEAVVEHGTGTPSKIQGFTVAGKTGTAEKLVNNRYSKSDYNVSFVGFLPSRQPALAIIVVIDSPHGTIPHFGGPVAGPVFRRIAEAALRHLGVAPTIDPMPPVLVARRDAPGPHATAAVETAAPVISLVSDGAPGSLPDLRGLSARDAMRTLVKVGLTAQMTGNGFVVSQEPAAGAPLETVGGVVRLLLDRSLPRSASAEALRR